jgi:RNA polymerase sigma-70 factor (ECF subfamily)
VNEEQELSDAEVVEQVLGGDVDRFGVLVKRYQRRLVGLVYRQVGDYDEALDLVQEVFIKVYGALDRFDPAFRFSTWLFRIAGNASIDHLRKKRLRTVPLARPETEDDADGVDHDPASTDRTPEQELRNAELAKRLELEIDALPDDYRELVSLRHFGELAYEEIAELKGMPLGTVKNKLFRARMILREKLRDYLEPI